jgi:hypothetical protein
MEIMQLDGRKIMKELNRRVGLFLLVIVSIICFALLFGRGMPSAESLGLSETSAIAEQTVEPRKITGTYRHQMLLPLEDLVSHGEIMIAIVVPVERKNVVAVSNAELTTMRSLGQQRIEGLEDRSVSVGHPFTPVEVEVVEVLKGDLTQKFEVWEERGEIAEFKVESDDPLLTIGIKGLLLAGAYENGVMAPLIFAPIQEGGYMPILEMDLAGFRKMLEE